MNLNNFSILKEDDNCYHVGHPNGKKLVINKSGISEKGHKLIQKLRGRKNYDEGGEVVENPELGGSSTGIPDYLGPNTTPTTLPQSIGGIDPDKAVNAQGIPEAIAALPAEDIKPTSNNDQQAVETAPTAEPKGYSPVDIVAGKKTGVEGALEAQKEAIQKEAQIEAGKSAMESKAIDEVQKKVEAMPTQMDLINANKAKDDALFKAFADKKIDPDRYMHNMTTGSKISTGIALVLGGLGSGMTGQPNAALGMLKDKIDQDIEAQKNDQGKASTLWRMNREALGNDMAASLATQNQMYTGLKYKIMQAGAQASGPIAVQRAAAATAQIDQQIQQNRFQMSMIQQGMGASGPNGVAGGDPSILVPNLVKDPVRQNKILDEIERAKVIKKQTRNILREFDAMAAEQKILSKNIIPGVESAHRKALRTELAPTFQTLDGNSRQATIDNAEHNILTQIGDSDATVGIKRHALLAYLRSGTQGTFSKSAGIDLNKFKSTSSDPIIDLDDQKKKFYDWAKANPKNPKSQILLKKLGIDEDEQ